MGNVIVLDEGTANKIAAGEVVERPASVVKELVENSLDSGASKISIDISKGGIASITVADDGEGIRDDDVLLAFERFATSKLRDAGDLERVATLGFRGEALPSIAAVSKVRLLTRRRGSEYGRLAELHGGRLVRNEAAGCPYGTSVTVSDLFYNLPARYKFLKKDAAEAAQIADLAGRLAIGRPDVAFTLRSQNAPVLHTQGGKPEDAIYAVFGKETLDGLVPVEKLPGLAGYSVTGFAGRPEIARANRNWQLFYVNGRLIKNRVAYSAVEDAYKTHLPVKRYPVAILYFEVEAELVDVNAHPAKTEVRFHNESDLFRAVHRAVESALRGMGAGGSMSTGGGAGMSMSTGGSAGMSMSAGAGTGGGVGGRGGPARFGPAGEERPVQFVGFDKGAKAYTAQYGAEKAVQSGAERASQYGAEKAAPLSSTQYVFSDRGFTAEHAGGEAQRVKEEPGGTAAYSGDNISGYQASNADNTVNPASIAALPGSIPPYSGLAGLPDAQTAFPDVAGGSPGDADAYAEIMPESGSPAALFAGARYAGQFFGTYLAFERDGALLLVDQHAAHERVLYERIKKQFESGAVQRQLLLESATVSLLPDEMHFAKSNEEFFKKAGFVFEEFGRGAIVLREAPMYSERTDIKEFFLETLEIARRDQGPGAGAKGAPAAFDEKLYQIACKAAVKGNRRLSAAEADGMLRSLADLPKPLTCPHGRPLIAAIPKSEFDKRFKRI